MKDISVIDSDTMQLQSYDEGPFASLQNFESAQRMAAAICSSTLFPKHYQGKDNIGNAIIALEMAQRLRVSPIMVAQNLYVVHGMPAWSSKFKIAIFNKLPRYSVLTYEIEGSDVNDHSSYRVRAKTEDLLDPENPIERYGPWITWDLVKSEGWLNRSGSKWQTMPEKMFLYRAASWLIDIVAPEISMGLPTDDEAREVIDVNPRTGEIEPPETINDVFDRIKKNAKAEQSEEIDNTEAPVYVEETANSDEPPPIDTEETSGFSKEAISGMIVDAQDIDALDEVQDIINSSKIPSRTKGSLNTKINAKRIKLTLDLCDDAQCIAKCRTMMETLSLTANQEETLKEMIAKKESTFLTEIRDWTPQEKEHFDSVDASTKSAQPPTSETPEQKTIPSAGETFVEKCEHKYQAFLGLIRNAQNDQVLDDFNNTLSHDETIDTLERGYIMEQMKKRRLELRTAE